MSRQQERAAQRFFFDKRAAKLGHGKDGRTVEDLRHGAMTDEERMDGRVKEAEYLFPPDESAFAIRLCYDTDAINDHSWYNLMMLMTEIFGKDDVQALVKEKFITNAMKNLALVRQ